MLDETHRAALRAASRVALAAVMAGCGSSAPEPTTASGALGAPAGSESAATGDDGGGPGPTAVTNADAACTPVAEAAAFCASTSPGQSQADCCTAEIASANVPADARRGAQPDLRFDAVTRGCCTILLGTTFSPDVSASTTNTCCEALGWDGVAACTPWGPPMPPPVEWVAGSERAVAAVLAA